MSKYAILCRNKLHSGKELSDAYKHNERIYSVANANPALAYKNVELVDCYGKNYDKIFEETMTELKMNGVKERAIRSNAVRGFEVMFTFSREKASEIDVHAWAKKSLEWADRYFNPIGHEIQFTDCRTGEEKNLFVQNIKHAVLHLDESNPHIHCFIVPIDEKGNLNASAYDGRRFMLEMQESYSREMEPFGLERGVRGSLTEHQKITKYYTYLKEAVDAELPEPEHGETLEEYRERANRSYQVERVHHRDDVVRLEQMVNRERAGRAQDKERRASRDKSVEKDLRHIRNAVGSDGELTREEIHEIRQSVSDQKKFKAAIEEYPDRGKAEEASRLFAQMVEWQAAREEHDRGRSRRRTEKKENAANHT